MALGVLFGFVRNQGDGWTLALDYLLRYLDDALNEAAPGAAPPGQAADLPDPDDFFLALARQLGLRTGADAPRFGRTRRRRSRFRAGADHLGRPGAVARRAGGSGAGDARRALERVRAELPEAAREARRQRDRRAHRAARHDPAAGARTTVAAVKTRHHGDFHLGQVIAVQNDFYIIDFEGEPAPADAPSGGARARRCAMSPA